MVGHFASDAVTNIVSFASDAVTDSHLILSLIPDHLHLILSLILDHLQVTKQGSLVHEDASLKLLREFRNEVERWQWRGVAFSNDDEHIIGASNAKNEHIMYVWNAVVGNLERILEGKHDELPNWTACLVWNCSPLHCDNVE